MAPISVAVGVTTGLIASLIQSIGLTLQRKSHLQNQAQDAKDQKSDWKRPLWLLGFLIFVTSNILGSVFQLGSLPIVILAPLGGVSLVWNALFASLILQDRFSKYLLLGTFLIAGGAVLIALFGAVPEPSHSLPQLLELYTRPAFLAWLGCLAVIVGIALVPAHIAERRLRGAKTAITESPLVTSPEVSSKVLKKTLVTGTPQGPLPTPAIVNKKSGKSVRFERDHARRWSEPVDLTLDLSAIEDLDDLPASALATSPAISKSFLPSNAPSNDTKRMFAIGITYGGVSGIMSGLCLLLAKTGVELLILSIVGKQNEFKHWQSWMIVLVLLLASLLQLWYLNRSLTLLGPTLICPLAFCFYNLSSILNGLVFYDQWRLLTPLKIGLVAVGIAVLLAGVWIVSLKSATPDSLDEGEVSEPSETSPLLTMQEPQDMYGSFESDRSHYAELRKRRGIEALKTLLLEAPSGLSIGLAASSPGFALRPAAKRVERGHADLRASTISLPPNLSAASVPTSPTFSGHGRSASEHNLRRNSISPTMSRLPSRHIANDLYVGEMPHFLTGGSNTATPPASPVQQRRQSASIWSSFFTSSP